MLAFPAEGDRVQRLPNHRLHLRVNNSQDPEQQALSYYFEIDTVNRFDSPLLQRSPAIEQASGDGNFTEWLVPELTEDTDYFWRVKANDGLIDSAWVMGHFHVSLSNQAPTTPRLNNPSDGSVITTLRPLFEWNPATDSDGNALSYRIQLYTDSQLTQPLMDYTTTNADTQWALDVDLTNHQQYYWRVQAMDDQQAVSEWSVAHQFSIHHDTNEAPQLHFVLPAQSTEVTTGRFTLQWVTVIRTAMRSLICMLWITPVKKP